ncbi:MAG TPA: helix-turn-helix transcriptional regulator [Planctomycetota bacterium]|nr:helix-turn-helix transcriptional regulator [Planctomycetota bacterium]
MSQFGDLVGTLRKQQGWTFLELGQKLGTTKSYVYGIESGKVRPPSLKKIRRYAQIFEVDLRMLVRLAWVDKAPDLIREDAEQFIEWLAARQACP